MKLRTRKQTGYSRSTINYGTTIPDGTYIVIDGQPVFLKRNGDGNTWCETLTRAESDIEDYWKGFGYMARDAGRFGGISAEDYVD